MKERHEEHDAEGSRTSKCHQVVLSQNTCSTPQKKTVAEKNNRNQVFKYRLLHEYSVPAHCPLLLSSGLTGLPLLGNTNEQITKLKWCKKRLEGKYICHQTS